MKGASAVTKPQTHTLYGSRGSGSAAIEIALRGCGVPYRLVRAATWEADSALAELGRVNPLRQIPTLLLPDGTVLTESAAILIHLGLSYPDSGLLPSDASQRAQVIRGLVYIAANCYSAIGIIDYPERWTSASTKPAQEKVRQGARQRLHHNWNVFADTFAAAPYLSGGALGALDILATVVSKWAGTRAHLARHRPALAALIHQVEAHPSVAPVLREHWAS